MPEIMQLVARPYLGYDHNACYGCPFYEYTRGPVRPVTTLNGELMKCDAELCAGRASLWLLPMGEPLPEPTEFGRAGFGKTWKLLSLVVVGGEDGPRG